MASLWELCKEGNMGGVRDALGMGEDINSGRSDGWTGLMLAVWYKHNSIVQFLLQCPGVDVNCQDALHWSTWSTCRVGRTGGFW